eukprot:TRINITY_DN11086_c0_g1_i2.p1 TRINITY_DN11086_c0_g1~~TRINITY_DN11086_c0_g1_i2.p1  ORF type:complete len:545 (+),score=101.24 TRINITY_DN11086_c0_g1_i2:153-1787(+)
MEVLEAMRQTAAAASYNELKSTGARNTVEVLLETAQCRSLRLFECDLLAPSLILDLDDLLTLMQRCVDYDVCTKSPDAWSNILRSYLDVIDSNGPAADLGQAICAISANRTAFTWFAVSTSQQADSLAQVLTLSLGIEWRWHARRKDLEVFSAATLIKTMDSCLGPRNLSLGIANGLILSNSRSHWRVADQNRILSVDILSNPEVLDLLQHASHLLKQGYLARNVVAAMAVYLDDHVEELEPRIKDALVLRPLDLPPGKLLLILDIDQTLMTVDTPPFAATEDMMYVAAHASIKAKRWLSRARSAVARDVRGRSRSLQSQSAQEPRLRSSTISGSRPASGKSLPRPATACVANLRESQLRKETEDSTRSRSDTADSVLLNQTSRKQRTSSAAIRPGVLDMIRELTPYCEFAIATAARGAHPYLVYELLQRELGDDWSCHRCVDRDEFELLHGDLKSVHIVLGGNTSLYNRCLILDDKPEAWAKRDQPRVIAMRPYYDRSPPKMFAKATQRLTRKIIKLHELYVKDHTVPLPEHMKKVFKTAELY